MSRCNPLYFVTDPKQSVQETCDTVYAAALAGVKWIQLRRKGETLEEVMQITQAAQEVLQAFDVHLIINDFIDVACQLEVAGVHLGQSDGCVLEARQRLRPHQVIGLTVESWEQLEQAQGLPIDHIGISSTLPTETKLDIQQVWGLDRLKQAVIYSKIPLVAIGGINGGNIQLFRAINLHSVAVTSAISGAQCPQYASRCLIESLRETS